MTKTERQKYKIAGPATWELVRAAYLAGESAPALAERFGVSAHAIRKRITAEKWTKRDYAAALEARGLEPPPKPAPLHVAARFAANYAPPPSPPEPRHPFADLVQALKQASAAAEAGGARAAFSDTPPVEGAAALERRALAQVGVALERGKIGDAKALAQVAEQMRRRAEEEREAERATADDEERDAAENENTAMHLFAMAAQIASHLGHEPGSAPAAFLRMIKRWREINLGEGAEDAERRAQRIADAQRRHFEGESDENLPEDVKAYLDARWQEMRERLDGS